MKEQMSPLQKMRMEYLPLIPKILSEFDQITFEGKNASSAIGDAEKLQKLFPKTFGRAFAYPSSKKSDFKGALRIGVVFSGGQAPGGHNVIAGLFDALKKLHRESQLYGFLGGPKGIIDGEYRLLAEDLLQSYRNQGGFDLLGSGRTKIETEEQLMRTLEVVKSLKLDGLVIIGGDDSNTNAAILAEFFLQKGCTTTVVGVPKTIDGDLKNEYVEVSFGFDTACKIFSEMIGNLARDTLSAQKYTHFIRLMGRSASHITLECALQTHPNFALIGEEIAKKNQTLKDIIHEIADMIEKRGNSGKNYGIVLIPEGLIEFIPEMKTLIATLNHLLAEPAFASESFGSLKAEEKIEKVMEKLPKEMGQVLSFLPQKIQQQLLLERDPHGNVQVSQIETEALLSFMACEEMKRRKEKGTFRGKFSPLQHFFGYEGRAGFPTNFDATYCYALGMVAVLLVRDRFSGYMTAVYHLQNSPEEWKLCGIPLTHLMHLETRKGKEKPVIRKALVDLEGPAFKLFQRERDRWKIDYYYRYPGPIQFGVESSYSDALPLSLKVK